MGLSTAIQKQSSFGIFDHDILGYVRAGEMLEEHVASLLKLFKQYPPCVISPL